MAGLARAEEKTFSASRGPTSSSRRAGRGPPAAAAAGAGEGASLQGPRSLSVPPAAVVAALGGPPEGPHVLLQQLLDYDIVIVPFEALQQEVWFAPPLSLTSSNSSSSNSSNSSSRMALRGTKRYRKLFSPILGIRWWRLVIDEAQLAGGEGLGFRVLGFGLRFHPLRLKGHLRRCCCSITSAAAGESYLLLHDLWLLFPLLLHLPSPSRCCWYCCSGWRLCCCLSASAAAAVCAAAAAVAAAGFSGAARLCHSIEAVHRWCVSGTPLLDELAGEGPPGPPGPQRGAPQAPRGSLLPRELAGLLAALRLSTDCIYHSSPALLQ